MKDICSKPLEQPVELRRMFCLNHAGRRIFLQNIALARAAPKGATMRRADAKAWA